MENPSATLSAVPALDNTYGALLLGTFVGLILYGLVIHQSFRYFHKFPNDRRSLKQFVGIMLAFETFHSALAVHWCYTSLVTNYSHPEALLLTTWSMNMFPALTGLAIFVSQCFYAYRVLLIGAKYRILVAVAILLSLVTLGCATANTALSFNSITVIEDIQRVKWIDSFGFIMAIISDTLTTGVLVFNLHQRRTGIRQTDHLIDRLIMYCLNTGLLIGVTNTILCVIGFFQTEALLFAGLVCAATKLYSNSVLAVLNSRRSSAPGNEAEESYPEVIVMSDIGTAPVGALPAAHVDIGRQLAAEAQYKLRPAYGMWGYHDSEDANGSRSTIEAKVAGIH
ncbi:hypothetical protein PYCCODRAFT_1434989 [Trametes coccinea BRFM310]|uniref:DUF6534 domain-containing protein n=1 Tax=Trametes coccinea (strain BRFM310) TaxID=1353009 RepID=A0A1Y2IPR3_TRAC3|nr:hypothetical protein PYCCODRAFT_1434989 [Trametes coccinea BRFM310]